MSRCGQSGYAVLAKDLLLLDERGVAEERADDELEEIEDVDEAGESL